MPHINIHNASLHKQIQGHYSIWKLSSVTYRHSGGSVDNITPDREICRPPQVFIHCRRVLKLFPLPLQPPNLNSAHLPVVGSYRHLGSRARQFPLTAGRWHTFSDTHKATHLNTATVNFYLRLCLLRLYYHLTPNGHYMGRTAQLTSRCCILYIYSASIRTEYFKHAA